MQAQYNSARRSSSGAYATFERSGQSVCSSGVTLAPPKTPVLGGVHGSREDKQGEAACWARLLLKMKRKDDEWWHGGELHRLCNTLVTSHKKTVQCVSVYFSLLSNSLSSCKLKGLPTLIDPSSTSAPIWGLLGLVNGVDVKQVFGLERGRSALTGVGFILLDGLDVLENKNLLEKHECKKK